MLTKTSDYDLIILYVMLPVINGLEVCRALRAGGVSTPVLKLTIDDEFCIRYDVL